MKTGPKPKRIATAEEVVRLAKKMKWSDIKSADGQIVDYQGSEPIIDALAGGRVYTGKQALELGLVDKIGTLQDAIAHIADLILL